MPGNFRPEAAYRERLLSASESKVNMATLEVREIFRLPSRRQFVIAGKLLDGTIETGMHALIWLDGRAFWRIDVKGVEFIDRFVTKESLLGLVCDESNVEDAETCHTLAPLGTVIEVAA